MEHIVAHSIEYDVEKIEEIVERDDKKYFAKGEQKLISLRMK